MPTPIGTPDERDAVRRILTRELGDQAAGPIEVIAVERVRRLTVAQRGVEPGQGRRVAVFLDAQRRWAMDLADAPMRDRDLGDTYRDADPFESLDAPLPATARAVTNGWRSRGETAPVAARWVDERVARCRVERVTCYVGLESDTLLVMRMRASAPKLASLALGGGTLLGAVVAILSFFPIGAAAATTVAGSVVGAGAVGAAREAWRRTRPRVTVVRLPPR